MPENTVKVARPGKYGNPYRIGISPSLFAQSVEVPDAETAVRLFKAYLNLKLQSDPHWLDELRGKNLACFCRLDQPCHADVLIEAARDQP